MAYSIDKKTGEITFGGFDKGIASSPHNGIANLKAVNISTEPGEVMCSLDRIQQSQVAGTGTLTQVDTSTVSVSGINLQVGSWIHITNGGTTGLSGDYYYLSTGKLATSFSQSLTKLVGNANVQVLAVAGGGGGGGSLATWGIGAGGGAGGVVYDSAHNISPGTYAIVIGNGGAGGTAGGNAGTAGQNTTFDTITALGGGGGGSFNGAATTGGSGGGAGPGGTGAAKTQGNSGGGTGFGNAGGNSTAYSGTGNEGMGGGGGAGAVGTNGAVNVGGNGGIGYQSSISGVATYYAGGGGGAGGNGTNGTGGNGGGGSAGNTSGNAATANTGGGGGGSNNSGNAAGGAGGSGTVVISAPAGTVHATGGVMTTVGGNDIWTFTSSGNWVVTSAVLSTNSYVTGITSGSATFSVYSMGSPIQKASEIYVASDGTTQYRYYILDKLGQVWIHDTFTLTGGLDTPVWFMTELSGLAGRLASGLAVINGWVCVTFDILTYWKSTSNLDLPFTAYSPLTYMLTKTFHSTLVGHQGSLYYTDGNFIGSITPNTGNVIGVNIQSVCSYTASTTTGTLTNVISGSLPLVEVGGLRVPVVFLTSGVLPTAITAGTIYWVNVTNTGSLQFNVYAASGGGAALDIQTGSLGTQFFNTFYPLNGGQGTSIVTYERVNLPTFEVATCLVELGNTVIIGGRTNTLYPWDQVSATPSDLIFLPESNTSNMITVENNAYVFAGQKGNVYITNGSSVSPAISVPDYAAGIAGTPSSYYEPYFTWGDAMFLRGRVYFSILDQTSAKNGTCGGIWSFTPTQNYFIGQDTGLALRLENRSSYGTYNGTCPVLLPSYVQTAIGPQYYSAWYSSITSPTYGIDFTSTIPGSPIVIETDLVATGTILEKTTFTQIEYKLSAPLANGETVQLYYRQNATDSFASCGNAITESSTGISGYFQVNFQKGQWLQLQVIGTPLASSSSSFIRFKEIKVR